MQLCFTVCNESVGITTNPISKCSGQAQHTCPLNSQLCPYFYINLTRHHTCTRQQKQTIMSPLKIIKKNLTQSYKINL